MVQTTQMRRSVCSGCNKQLVLDWLTLEYDTNLCCIDYAEDAGSTCAQLVRRVTPNTVKNGSIQNPSRQRDARNAISCAATWLAVSDGILNGNFVHSWDECGVMLNAFNEKQTVKCTASGRRKLSERNLAPATTEIQQQRRMLKLGLSTYC